MVKYKVIALSVGGKGNNVFNVGEIVKDENFIDAKALVKSGFLKEIEVPKKSTPKSGNNKKS